MIIEKMKNFFNVRETNSEIVETYYEEWHERYVKGFGDTFQSHRPSDMDNFFRYLLKSIDIKDSHIVIDAGCGVGGPLFGMAKLSNAIFNGVTISNSQINSARQRLENDKVGNVNLIKHDYHKLNQLFDENSVDRVYFLESFVHSNNKYLVLKNVKQILKPGGKIYIKDLFERVSIDKNDKAKISKSVKINNKLFRLHIEPKEQLLLYLRSLGFKLEFCKILDVDANQDVGNKFVLDNNLIKNLSEWHSYLEWYEIRATKISDINHW